MSNVNMPDARRKRIDPSKYQNGTKSVLRVSFPAMVEVMDEEYLYPFLVLVAEIGGYLSFMLGLSALNIATHTINWIQDKIGNRKGPRIVVVT